MHVPVSVTIALDKALNAYLQLSDTAQTNCEKLGGKLLALELRGLNTTLYFLPEKNHLHVRSFTDQTPDALISATPLALVQLALQQNADKALFAGQVKITGDTEAAQTFQDILSGADIEWEEHLSQLTGDIIAHQLGRGIRGFINWADQSRSSLQADISDYLLHEAKLLPDREDVEHFLNEVDQFRADVERLSIRLTRYEQTLKS